MARAEALRLAVAQVAVTDEVPTYEVLTAAGSRVRCQMGAAAAAGARLVVFPEGSLSHPSKRLMSRHSPQIEEADWAKVDWDALRGELDTIAAMARALGIWTVVGGPHLLSYGQRPHNSLYVFSDQGRLVNRYDKRRLSVTEVTYMYTPGTEAVTFDVDGFQFGTVLCLEVLFPELFVEYAAMDVDAVLVCSAPSRIFGLLARSHAIMNALTIGLAVGVSQDGEAARSGICTPDGWISRCADGAPGVAIADIARHSGTTFQRQARTGLYDEHVAPNDPRSLNRQLL